MYAGLWFIPQILVVPVSELIVPQNLLHVEAWLLRVAFQQTLAQTELCQHLLQQESVNEQDKCFK